MKREILLASLLFAIAAPASLNAAPKQKNERPETFEALLRCRSVTDEAARLACFDKAAAAIETAASQNDLVVIDRQQIRKTKRTLFGLPMPDIDLFREGDDREKVQSVEGTVASASQDGSGKWLVRLREGGFWRQIDDRPLGRAPRPGSKIVINRTPFGSYMMRVDGQPGVRVRRES